ncbi:aminotransferase class I/II-fold pyridoxal phosphate-dependent enzyme [Pedobacter sp. AW31-3R]|uniref:aminotransferase class I/II-fold pyridoxal phosphate-dependent enzyme n=1 Tax=Pedobacter sp. AW31-3R TaxID=3445781 RepID=UPI003FA01BE6
MKATLLMEKKLQFRKDDFACRKLQVVSNLIDFSSNDYLGLSRSETLHQQIKESTSKKGKAKLGSTGSRLITGNTAYAEELEEEIAAIHQEENGLIFNSGYAANMALFSCLPQKGDTILTDEYIHASVIDGARLSFARRIKFRHNDLDDLEKKLSSLEGIVYVAVESVYSMEGDSPDLLAVMKLCQTYQAQLIVDEAHAFGVLGTGLVDQLGLQGQVFARIITFGKALGLHGAIIVGPQLLKDYLINFARPLIYSTALPLDSLIAIKTAYNFMLSQKDLQRDLLRKSELFVNHMPPQSLLFSTRNPTAIQCVFISGNIQVRMLSDTLQHAGFDVRPILSPTVPAGKERLRICLHLHNTDEEILSLCREFSKVRLIP